MICWFRSALGNPINHLLAIRSSKEGVQIEGSVEETTTVPCCKMKAILRQGERKGRSLQLVLIKQFRQGASAVKENMIGDEMNVVLAQ